MNRVLCWSGFAGVLLVLGPGPLAAASEPAVEVTWQAVEDTSGIAEVMTDGFFTAHPDLRWRGEGLRVYAQGDHVHARELFLRAARFADKPSQAMLAEMHWNGIGMKRDRALGYAWMDLAAERGYPNFLILRERYWADLDDATRGDAIRRGQAVYAEYGDDVAKPRLEKVLRRERRTMTGSRTGIVGNLTIIPNTGPLGRAGIMPRGDQFYAREYWEPEAYWALQDEIWNSPGAKLSLDD